MTDPAPDSAAPARGSTAPAPNAAPPAPDSAIADGAAPTAPDATLGGYLRLHDRPPAFEGEDGHPYTVSLEVEKVADLRAPWRGYLVFPRWAATGVGIVGHVETDIVSQGRDADEARAALESLPLTEVRALLDGAIRRRASDAS